MFLQMAMHPVLYQLMIFFVSFSLICQLAYLLYHVYAILLLLIERLIYPAAFKSDDLKAQRLLARGFYKKISTYYLFYEFATELIKFYLLTLALSGPRSLVTFVVFFPITLLGSWFNSTDELVGHLDATSTVDGSSDTTASFILRLLGFKTVMFHLACIAGVLCYSHYVYTHKDSFFGMYQ